MTGAGGGKTVDAVEVARDDREEIEDLARLKALPAVEVEGESEEEGGVEDFDFCFSSYSFLTLSISLCGTGGVGLGELGGGVEPGVEEEEEEEAGFANYRFRVIEISETFPRE